MTPPRLCGSWEALRLSRSACASADVHPFANEPRVHQHRAPLQNPVPTSSAEKVELMSIENLKINGAHSPLSNVVAVSAAPSMLHLQEQRGEKSRETEKIANAQPPLLQTPSPTPTKIPDNRRQSNRNTSISESSVRLTRHHFRPPAHERVPRFAILSHDTCYMCSQSCHPGCRYSVD